MQPRSGLIDRGEHRNEICHVSAADGTHLLAPAHAVGPAVVFWPVVLAVLCLGLSVPAAALSAPLEGNRRGQAATLQAESILAATGVKGGLVALVGCGDEAGQLAADLAAAGPFLVHALEPDQAKVQAARKCIRDRGLYGKASVECWPDKRLPYVDNLVNLIVIAQPELVPEPELMRALTPGGLLYIKQGSGWQKRCKPWPESIDDWTHFLHDATNNAVSADRVVGPPRHLQWAASPTWTRSHDHLASVSACVSGGGRLFAIVDHGPIAAVLLPARWMLIARDAFNGVLLWQRPISSWEWHLRGFRSGPSDIARRLVAVGDVVYVTLGYDQPVCALDAATGRTLRCYEETKAAREIIHQDGVLYVVADGAQPGVAPAGQGLELVRPGLFLLRAQRPEYFEHQGPKRIVAVDACSGRLLWEKRDADTRSLMPTTLCATGKRVLLQNDSAVICLDAHTGKQLWRAERPVSRNRPAWSAPTLVVWPEVVISADRATDSVFQPQLGKPGEVAWIVTSAGGNAPPGEMIAFSLSDGRRLWSAPCRECYNAPVDVLIADGLVW